MLLYIGPVVGHGAFRAVLMDLLSIDADAAILGVDTAKAVAFFLLYDVHTLVVETEVRAGAEVAVEALHIVALFVFSVERAEVGLVYDHRVKVEIVDDLLFAIAARKQLVDNGLVLFAVFLEP